MTIRFSLDMASKEGYNLSYLIEHMGDLKDITFDFGEFEIYFAHSKAKVAQIELDATISGNVFNNLCLQDIQSYIENKFPQYMATVDKFQGAHPNGYYFGARINVHNRIPGE